jgi:hypothetical protein
MNGDSASAVTAQPHDHRRKPSTEIPDLVRSRPIQPEPGLRHHVLRIRQQPEDSGSGAGQPRALLLEPSSNLRVALISPE